MVIYDEKAEREVIQSPDSNNFNGVIYPSKLNNTVAIIIATVLFVFIFLTTIFFANAENVYIQVYVEGKSMHPTLNLSYNSVNENGNDIVYLNTLNKGSRGDIIVSHYPIKSSRVEYIIKRLIAVEGDTLRIVVPDDENLPSEIYVNGELLVEDYISQAHFEGLEFLDYEDYKSEHPEFNPIGNSKDGQITLPQGYVFYMGDNRAPNASSDCRERGYGPQLAKNIVGKVDFIVRYGVDEDISSSILFWTGAEKVLESIKNSFFSFI